MTNKRAEEQGKAQRRAAPKQEAVTLEYWNGKAWAHAGSFLNERIAWVSLGGDDLNYRTISEPQGLVLTDKRAAT